jgi:ABC-2 type transport system permease protein
MSAVVTIARDEWRQWRRSRLAVAGLAVFAALLVIVSTLTALDVSEARHERLHQQAEAEQTFLDQPDRHPHRMVHYGHYVFRAPAPLALFDPGVDSVTGQSIFLEGHRQNSAMFADVRAQARTGGFGALTPAKLYHLFLPLLLIALGHAAIVREREARTLGPLLSQGVSGTTLMMGKALALAGLIGVLSLPALIGAIIGVVTGESALAALMLYAAHLLYLGVWGAFILFVSVVVQSRGVALGVCVFAWFATSLVIPRIGVMTAGAALPMEGKIITDMRMKEDLRKLGDGHNAADPAFAKLRANLLAQYDVDTVEELPINFRGAVAQKSEADLTDTLNQYAERSMASETAQAELVARFGWLSPYVAISTASRQIAGTDLATHHRFLREAESLRYDFVQGLNKAHVEELDYQADMNRNNGEEGWRLARISSQNWQVLDDFAFAPDPADMRLKRASEGLLALLLWLAALLGTGLFAARRLKP